MNKILFVTTGLMCGGAETQLYNMVSFLNRMNLDCLVVSMTSTEEGIAHRFLDNDIKIVTLNMPRGKIVLRSIFEFRKIVHDFSPDVIHSHMIHANLFSRISCLKIDIPLVNTAHSIFEGGRLLEVLYRITYPICDYMTQVSEEGYHRYLQHSLMKEKNSCVMKNSIIEIDDSEKGSTIREELLIEEKSFLFICIGRLEHVKNHELLLRALVNTNAHCLLVGVGPLETRLKELSIELKVDNRVYFLGQRDDIYSLMSVSDALIMTSSYEGLPITILEALESGLPIISTDVGAISNVVGDDNGILVAPNSIDDLTLSINRLMSASSEVREKMSTVSRNKAKPYHVDKVCDSWLALYKRLSS